LVPIRPSTKLDLQMPDLSSVRRNSEAYDLRLSLPGPEERESEDLSMEIEREQSSFDISIKGSPNSFEKPGEDEDTDIEKNEPASSILGSQIKDKRRDSIACFFNSNQSTPTLLAKKGSRFDTESLTIPSMNGTPDSNAFSVGTLKSVLATKSPLDSTVPVKSPSVPTRRSMRHRDSIACFFESPKIRSIQVTPEPHEEPADETHDVSMELDSPSRGKPCKFMIVRSFTYSYATFSSH